MLVISMLSLLDRIYLQLMDLSWKLIICHPMSWRQNLITHLSTKLLLFPNLLLLRWNLVSVCESGQDVLKILRHVHAGLVLEFECLNLVLRPTRHPQLTIS